MRRTRYSAMSRRLVISLQPWQLHVMGHNVGVNTVHFHVSLHLMGLVCFMIMWRLMTAFAHAVTITASFVQVCIVFWGCKCSTISTDCFSRRRDVFRQSVNVDWMSGVLHCWKLKKRCCSVTYSFKTKCSIRRPCREGFFRLSSKGTTLFYWSHKLTAPLSVSFI